MDNFSQNIGVSDNEEQKDLRNGKNDKKRGKFLTSLFLVFTVFFVLALPHLTIMINAFALGKIHESSEITSFEGFFPDYSENNTSVIIVFGAGAPYNKASTVFADRLKVASDLYFSGKSQKILISGDNSEESYNEPNTGKVFLEELGVHPEDIVLDYAGFRTYDTCIRAKEIFGVNQAYLVTQEFHLPRSLFICEEAGIESIGFSSSLQDYRGTLNNLIRESIAHQLTFYEVFLFPHDPKFLGKEEFIFE